MLRCSIAGWTLVAALVSPAATPRTDRFGQPAELEFAGKVHDESELRTDAAREARTLPKAVVRDPARFDAHGGVVDPSCRFRATGFFRTEQAGGRWWLVTPEGNRFYLIGCDSIDCREPGYATPLLEKDGKPRDELRELPDRSQTPGAYHCPDKVNFLVANLQRKYGLDFDRTLDDVLRRRYADWGFNSTGKWGYKKKLDGMAYFQDSSLPWACRLGAKRRFVDMYHPDFARLAESLAQRLAERRRGDRDLIAYACGNEDGWTDDALKDVLAAPDDAPAGGSARRAFLSFVAGLRRVSVDTLAGSRDVAAFTVGERSAFVRASSRRYHETLRAALRRHDPDHLFMGASQCFPAHADWIRGALPFVDLVGLHEYSVECLTWFRTLLPDLEAAHRPFAVLEFSFVTTASGHAPYGSVTCRDQRARGLCYRRYAEYLAQEPLCLGASWFICFDQPVNGRSLGGEAHNFGLISQQDRPYVEALDEIRKSNARLFDLHLGRLTDPFEIEDFGKVLVSVDPLMRFRRLFVPGSIPASVRSDWNDPDPAVQARFHGNLSRITFRDGTFGWTPFGTVRCRDNARVVARYVLWNRIHDILEWPTVEVSADGRPFRDVPADRTVVWKGDHFLVCDVAPLASDAETRFVRFGADVRSKKTPWAVLLADVNLVKYHEMHFGRK